MDRPRDQRATAQPQNTRTALEAMGHLHRLSSLIASDHLDEALSAAVDIPVRCLGIDSAALLMPTLTSDDLRLLAGCNLREGLGSEMVSFGGDDLIGWVMRNGSPKAVTDVASLPPDTASAYLRNGIRSAACVPVENGNPLPGALLCISSAHRDFAVWEVEMLSMVANQVSSVLRRRDTAEIGFEYARLFEQSKIQTRQLRSLYRVARTITSSLQLDEVVKQITQYLCRNLSADVCALVMYDHAYGEVRLAGGYSALGGDQRQYLELIKPAIKSALKSKRPVEYADLLSSPAYANVGVVRDLGLGSGVVAALAIKGNIIGFIAAFRRQRHGFSREAVKVLPGLAELAAIALENARLYQRQSDIAHIAQKTLVPTTMPGIPGFEVGYKYAPAYQVGGDYCDIVGLKKGLYGIVVADVAGRDIAAASHIAMCRHSFRATADEIRSPGALMAKMNRLVCQQTEPEGFISMVYAVLNPATRKLTLTSAGHEPALVFRAESGAVEELSTNGLLLGIESSETYSSLTSSIQPGDVLALYTDGLVDAFADSKTTGVERLKSMLAASRDQAAQQMADSLYNESLAKSDRSPDDVALILLRAI